MFSITCRTCAAKLKVKNATAIGQRLACPKCGEMVEVIPPPGWQPPEGESHAPEGPASSLGDFDDIDRIIGGATARLPGAVERLPGAVERLPGAVESKSPKVSSGKPTSSTPRGRSSPKGRAIPDGQGLTSDGSEPGPGLSTPDLPDETSPAVRKQSRGRERPPGELPPTTAVPLGLADKPLLAPREDKFELTQPREYLPDPNLPPPDWSKQGNGKSRKLLVSGLLVVGLLAAIAAIIALLNQSSERGKGDRLAENKQAPAETKASQEASAAKDPSAETTTSTDQPPSTPDLAENEGALKAGSSTEEGPNPVAKPDEANEQPAGLPSQGGETAEMNPTEQGNNPSSTPAEPVQPDSLPGTEERPDSPLVKDETPLNRKPNEPATTNGISNSASPNAGPTSITDRLGKLSQLLSGPGTSLTELGDLAQSERTDRLVGLPRYLISRPEPFTPPSDPWSIPIAEVAYTGAPLHLFLTEFSTLTGVPICLDALAVVGAGTKVDSPIELDLSNTTTGEVLAIALKTYQLERTTLEGVEVVQPAGAQTTNVYRFPLPAISEPSPEKFQQFADRLPKLIDPVSWTLDSANRKVTIEGNELVVSNHRLAADQVGELLAKLSAAERLKTNPQDEEAAQRLKSRNQLARQGLAKPLQLAPTLDQPIEQFLGGVYRQSGVAITMDWAALKAAGWSSRSIVPGDFKADNVEQLLKELARSLSATWVAIDDHTFELTSFQQASRRATVEVYSLQGLGVEPQPLLEILTQTLGAQLRENPLVQFFYEPEVHALVVVAPQPLQRQFEAIVDRLKKPAAK